MKTYILQLESHDDIISVRDKMGWAKDSRILIVWPEEGDLLNRRLDLVLLKRQAQKFGTQIALVSRDREVRYQGPRLGIKVFKSVRSAQNQPWRVSHRFRAGLPSEAEIIRYSSRERAALIAPEQLVAQRREMSFLSRIVFFAMGVLAVLALAAVLAPSAQVQLQPKTLVQDAIIKATTGPEIEDVNIAGSVPSEVIEVDVEGRDSQPVSGSIRLPYQSAEGIAVFSNLTDEPVEIPKGTVVRTDANQGSRYETIQKILVPAGQGQTAQADIRCLSPGKAGNIPAGSLAIVEGVFSTRLSISNPQAIIGGSDRLEPAPAQIDREELAARLESALKANALQEVERQLTDGDLLLPSSLKRLQTLEETYQPDGQLPADILLLHTRIRFQAQIVRAASLENMSETVFDVNLPAGYQPVAGSLHFETVEGPFPHTSDRSSWVLHATRRVEALLAPSQVIRISLGLEPEDAIERLESALPLEDPPRISVQPSWWPRLPVLHFRIQVINQAAEGNALRIGEPLPDSSIFPRPLLQFSTVPSLSCSNWIGEGQ